MYFDKQEFMVMHKCSAYYASIMLNAFSKGSATPKNPVRDFKSLQFFKISSNYGKISEQFEILDVWNIIIT